MKKILLALLLVALSSVSVFAAASGTIGPGINVVSDDTVAVPIGRLSPNVYLTFNTAKGGYAIATINSKGTKAFGGSFDSNTMYVKPIEKWTETVLESDINTNDSSCFDDWESI
ncbi:hypothetical protein [uncultured Desulfuromonas sp.]|uniref:hypothetical protein n=1 Tax=uncultured Desulfuromonas sp. TaxID=181013 RepID=UPI002AAACA32|nr:hypothetical protein [uncultured Desulfuromonas sp.]